MGFGYGFGLRRPWKAVRLYLEVFQRIGLSYHTGRCGTLGSCPLSFLIGGWTPSCNPIWLETAAASSIILEVFHFLRFWSYGSPVLCWRQPFIWCLIAWRTCSWCRRRLWLLQVHACRFDYGLCYALDFPLWMDFRCDLYQYAPWFLGSDYIENYFEDWNLQTAGKSSIGVNRCWHQLIRSVVGFEPPWTSLRATCFCRSSYLKFLYFWAIRTASICQVCRFQRCCLCSDRAFSPIWAMHFLKANPKFWHLRQLIPATQSWPTSASKIYCLPSTFLIDFCFWAFDGNCHILGSGFGKVLNFGQFSLGNLPLVDQPVRS